MKAAELHRKAVALGLRLEPRGDRLAVIPAERAPAEFVIELRENKTALLEWLNHPTAPEAEGVAENCRPRFDSGVFLDWPSGAPASRPAERGGTEAQWLHIAAQVMAGEFNSADKSLRASLTIGLRNIRHPSARAALARIEEMH